MVDVIEVRYGKPKHRELFDCQWVEIKKDDPCVVTTDRGVEFGVAVSEKKNVNPDKVNLGERKILRLATEADVKQFEGNTERNAYAKKLCEKKIREHRRDMNLIDVEYVLDGSKVIFYYTAEQRVDFRSLVRELAYLLGTRIEMRHVGVRDKSRMVGGYGPCGQSLCCTLHCKEFEPVSIKMAKEQKLTLNPAKISGICDRLMCCLRYEYETYKKARKRLPRLKSQIQTPKGPGIVVDYNVISGDVVVETEPGVRIVFTAEELGIPADEELTHHMVDVEKEEEEEI